MPEQEPYEIRDVGGKKVLVVRTSPPSIGPSLANYPDTMRLVVKALVHNRVDAIVLSDVYERYYEGSQVKLLQEVALAYRKFKDAGLWSLSIVEKLGKDCQKAFKQEGTDLVKALHDIWPADPVAAYLKVLGIIKRVKAKEDAAPQFSECAEKLLKILRTVRAVMESTAIIAKAKSYILRIGKIPSGRSFYSLLFQPQLKPSFVESRVLLAAEEDLEILDQYTVLDSEVYIYKHPDQVEPLYYLVPPEFSLPEQQYVVMEKTKELVSQYSPKSAILVHGSPGREQFIELYEDTLRDVAKQMSVRLSSKDVRFLANILARHTVGYGILELLLMDKRITDIYVDAPLGSKPVYLVHSNYGQCQSNVVLSTDDALSLVSKFRAMSGRPFDESHPVLDYDLPDVSARVAVIGPPLSPDGIAFAFRLHKPTPWTLPQFIDNKMISPLGAGLLSFFIDSQATMLVAGSRGAGKTSLMTALILEIPQNQRILTQEDTLEIPVEAISHLGFHIQRLKTKSPIAGGASGELPPEDALRTALRLGDSAIVIGEVRSKEAKVLYEAMRVGAAGSVVMGTIHGDSAYSVWDRVVNDLGVPTTSFKATDVVVVNAPIRFAGSLRRHRRTVAVTEIRKHWNRDPMEEGGFLDLMRYSAKADELQLLEDNIKESDLFSKVMELRGLSYEQIWEEINARALTKKYLVELKRKHKVPELLEGVNTVPAHNKFLLLKEKYIEEHGAPDYDEILKEWRTWVEEVLLRRVLAKRDSNGHR